MFSKLFRPRRIAVVGASPKRGKLGGVVYRNIIKNGFHGSVFPVNISGGSIQGKKIYPSVSTIPGSVDVVIIVVPANAVPLVLKECGKKNIPFAIIISAGFSEIGDVGKKREDKLRAIARKYRIRILGPNCLGILSPYAHLNASFAEGLPEKGHVAVISQSGAMAVAITDWARATDLGFSYLISLGNKADIAAEELLRYLERDSQTHVIVMYLESLLGGRELLRTIKRVSKTTPIVVLKPGKTTEARNAVASHTGALAGSYEVERALLRHAGAVVVDTLEELFLFTKTFEQRHRINDNTVAVVTNAGGPGILATDAIVSSGLRMATFSPATYKKLHNILPETASVHNPIDVVGDAPPSRYRDALEVALRDKNVNAVIVLLTHQYVTETNKIAKIIVGARRGFPKKVVVVSFIGGNAVREGREILTKANIPHFQYPQQAVRAVAAIWNHSRAHLRNFSFIETAVVSQSNNRVVLGKNAEKILKKYISSMSKSFLAQSKKYVVKYAHLLGYPLVAKVIRASASHKTEKGFVKVNITNDSELVRATKGWLSRTSFKPGEGILLQKYTPGLLELFIGSKRDPLFGPYIIFGIGGIFVESFRLTDIAPIPFTQKQAEHFIRQGLLSSLFQSKRGKKLPVREIAHTMVGLSRLFIANPSIVDVDLNPVMVTPTGIIIVDARVIQAQ